MNENSKLQNSFVNIILVLLFITYAAYGYVAIRCFAPFNFFGQLTASSKSALWSLMLLPAVILPIALWLANMLNRKLSGFSLLSVLLTSCFVIAIPRLYLLTEPYEAAYLTSVFVIFLITCSTAAIIKDLKKKKEGSPKRALNTICATLLLLVFMFILFIMSILVFEVGRFYGIALCFFIPFIAALCILESLLSVYSRATFILKLISFGLGCLCCGIIELCTELWATLFVLMSLLALIWQLIDFGKYIIVRRDEE